MFLLFFSASFHLFLTLMHYKRQKWVKNCRGKNQNLGRGQKKSSETKEPKSKIISTTKKIRKINAVRKTKKQSNKIFFRQKLNFFLVNVFEKKNIVYVLNSLL